MKDEKKFLEPTLEILEFTSADVILTSNLGEYDDDDPNTPGY